jgi:hypothetical protein
MYLGSSSIRTTSNEAVVGDGSKLSSEFSCTAVGGEVTRGKTSPGLPLTLLSAEGVNS